MKLIDGLWKIRDKYPNHLTYPTIRIQGRSVYLPTALGNVTTNKGNRFSSVNTTFDRSFNNCIFGIGQIVSASAWNLVYKLQTSPPWVYRLSLMWEKEFQKAMGNFQSNVIGITYFHSQSLDDELVRTGKEVQPKFSLTFIILVSFAILCK